MVSSNPLRRLFLIKILKDKRLASLCLLLKIIAAEQTDASEALHTFSPADGQPYALVFGHEVFGVQDDVLGACDACVEIPQQGVKQFTQCIGEYGHCGVAFH